MTEINFARFYPTVMQKLVSVNAVESMWINEYVDNAECLKRLYRENPADRQLRNIRREHNLLWLTRLQNPEVFTAVTEKALEILMFVRGILEQRHIRIIKALVDGFIVEKIGDLQLENINREIVSRYPVGPMIVEPRRLVHY